MGSLPAMRVLVVEDEPLIREILAEELADAGLEVLPVGSGDDAAALLKSQGTAFSLLITDIHMPGNHDGLAVAQLARRRNPLLPVIYMSGRPDMFEKLRPLGANVAVLAKPFLPSELVQVARRLLHGAIGSEP